MTARSYLYVPATRPDMLHRALDRQADAVVVDLEDSVVASRKEEARRHLVEWLAGVADLPSEVWVRVNPQPELLAADLVAISDTELTGVFLPKATPATVAAVAERLPTHLLVPLIETAEAVGSLDEVAAVPRVVRLGMGEADLIAALGMDPSSDRGELLPIRIQVVVASAAAGLESPIGPVSVDYRNVDALEISTEKLRRMGFGARTAVHPAQVPVINRVFTPSAEAVERARRLLEGAERAASEGNAVYVEADGTMVDEAVLRSARRVVELAERYHAE